jgi:hypothetical protein
MLVTTRNRQAMLVARSGGPHEPSDFRLDETAMAKE